MIALFAELIQDQSPMAVEVGSWRALRMKRPRTEERENEDTGILPIPGDITPLLRFGARAATLGRNARSESIDDRNSAAARRPWGIGTPTVRLGGRCRAFDPSRTTPPHVPH